MVVGLRWALVFMDKLPYLPYLNNDWVSSVSYVSSSLFDSEVTMKESRVDWTEMG